MRIYSETELKYYKNAYLKSSQEMRAASKNKKHGNHNYTSFHVNRLPNPFTWTTIYL